MFKNWQHALTSGAASTKPAPESMSPTLRADIYAALDLATPWLVGATPRSAGDGISYQPILALVHNHFPELTLPIQSIGDVESEVALVVAGITDMVLEMSKWDGMAGAMTMRTWVDMLSDARARIDRADAPRRERVGRGITRGINELTDVSLMAREFAPRIQIISMLKSVNVKVHGAGSEEARRGEALLSSKVI